MEYERTNFSYADQYVGAERVSSLGQLPTHRQVIYGRTFSAMWNRKQFDAIEHYKAPARWSWSDLGYMFVGICVFAVAIYAAIRFIF